MKKFVGSIIVFGLLTGGVSKEIELPKPNGDKGQYYLIKADKKKSNFITIHKRVGVYDTLFLKTEISCSKNQVKVLGESYESADRIKPYNDSQWVDVVDGSSKSYLVNYICKNYK
ncbi:MAG: hypothetical protein RBT59_03235 [Arcobacteraceae bacterium]|nr:hypothetical protein [Arcobacteraceae bacterium]